MSTVVVASSGSGQTGCPAGNELVNRVARVIGGEQENELRSQSLSVINRVRIRLNRRDWHFMKKQAGAITLVDGTQTYSLPSAFKKPSYAQLLDTSGKPERDLEFTDDALFSHRIGKQESGGPPNWYWLRNHYDDGLISLYPVPDAGTAADLTLRVEYFGRIANIQDTSVAVDLPEEVCDVLVLGGQYFLLRDREKNSPALAAYRADFVEAENSLQVYDRRISDEHPRFSIRARRSPFGTMFIRVS